MHTWIGKHTVSGGPPTMPAPYMGSVMRSSSFLPSDRRISSDETRAPAVSRVAPDQGDPPPRRAPLRGMRDRSLRGRVPPISALVTRRTPRHTAARGALDHVGHLVMGRPAMPFLPIVNAPPRRNHSGSTSKAPAAKPACVGPIGDPAIGDVHRQAVDQLQPGQAPQHQAATVEYLGSRRENTTRNGRFRLREEQHTHITRHRPRRADHRNARTADRQDLARRGRNPTTT